MFFCIPQGVLCYSKVPVSIVKALKSEGTKKLNTLLFLLPININYALAVFQFLYEWNAEEQSLLNVVSKVIDGTPFTSFNFSSQNKSYGGEKKLLVFFVKANFSSISLHKKCF